MSMFDWRLGAAITDSGSVAHDTLMQARAAGGTWVLAFAMPRHAKETLAALQSARRAGLKVALITDLTLGPLVEEADVALTAATGSRLVFDSYAAPNILSAAVLQAMADADPERTQARLENYEQVAEQHRRPFAEPVQLRRIVRRVKWHHQRRVGRRWLTRLRRSERVNREGQEQCGERHQAASAVCCSSR